jgi:hypothetical protein
MTDQQKQARLIVALSEENRLLRKREKQLEKIVTWLVRSVESPGESVVIMESDLARWRKVVGP